MYWHGGVRTTIRKEPSVALSPHRERLNFSSRMYLPLAESAPNNPLGERGAESLEGGWSVKLKNGIVNADI